MKRAFDEISDDEWGDAAVNLDRAIKRPVHENHISNGNGLKKEVKVLPPLESFAFKTKSKGIISTPQRSDHPLEDDDFQVTKGRSIGSRGRRFVVDESDEEFEPMVERERTVVALLGDENESLGTGLQHAKVVDVEDVVEIDPNLEEEHAEDDVIANALQKCDQIAVTLREDLYGSGPSASSTCCDRYAEVDASAARIATQGDIDAACNYKSSMFQPILKPYQLVGVNFLLLLHRKGIGGAILADEMGLGKTVQAIIFLSLLRHLDKDPGPHLVVCPASVLENWEREFKKWCPSFTVIQFHGAGRAGLSKRLNYLAKSGAPPPFNVVLVCYSLFERHSAQQKDDRKVLKKWRWSCVLMDEAHVLKDRSSYRRKNLMAVAQNAKQRLMLTGTPLQNDLEELWSLLEFMMPNIFETGDVDLKKVLGASAEDTNLIARIKTILGPFILRRLKSDVMQQLVQKTQKIESLTMVPEQAAAYKEAIEEYRAASLARLAKNAGSAVENVVDFLPRRQISNYFTQFRKIANHPLLVRRIYTETDVHNLAKILHARGAFGDQCTLDRVREEILGYNDFSLHQLSLSYGGVGCRGTLDDRHALCSAKCQERRVNAQMAAIQSFSFKQLLDEACKDITDKTDYEYFAKKWGHDQRFEVLGCEERKSLFNERVISLRKTLKEKVKARQVTPIDSFSHSPEGNQSNVPLLVGKVEDFIEDLIMSDGGSLPVEQLDKGNPSNVPLHVGELLDVGFPDDIIEGLIMSVGDSLPVEQLIKEYEKRNRLQPLKNILENLVREGSQDVHVHSALGKIRIDTNDKPEHFLKTNLYYDSYVVGKHCEKRNPTLAVASYWRGKCDDELIDVSNKNFLFEQQARYVVERADPQLWKRVLALENPHRRKLIDRVASTVLPESNNSDQVSATVEAFINADRPDELIELLEKIVLQNSTFSGNPNLQELLIHTAIEADRSRLMDYINRLDNFDGPAIGEIAIGKKLYEEAFNIFKKFNLNVQAVNVLLDHIRSFERAYQFASHVKKDVVWSQVAKAQLREGLLSDAIESFIRADDATQFPDVIRVAEEASLYHNLVKYLFMVKKNVKEPKVHTEVNAKLASAFVKLRQFQKAFDAARNVNRLKTWKEVCFACVDAEEFRLARLCGFNIIVQEDGLEEVREYYQKKGRINELISLMEEGLRLDSWHTSLKELHILYAKYRPDKLKEHIALF